jgi:hypothetical protein
MLCYYLACSFCKIDLKLEVISFTELVFCAWLRTRMSTDESRAGSSTHSRRGCSWRAGSPTRSRRGFSWRVKTRTRSRRGFSKRAKTRARIRRVVLSPRPTALCILDSTILGRRLRGVANYLQDFCYFDKKNSAATYKNRDFTRY